MKKPRTAALAASLVAAASLLGLTTTPATASSRHGCEWPNVCFYLTITDYNNNRPTATFQDVTSGFQTLGSRSRGARAIVNTRNDDRVMIRFSDAGMSYTTCVEPNQSWTPVPSVLTVTHVKIETQSACPTGPF